MNKTPRVRRTDPALMEAIADRLKSLRAACGYTQEQVYESTGLNMQRMESGQGAMMIHSLNILCRFYGVSLEEFFRGIESK